ncbi:MAG: SDR family NAD(P)-dependent oxidoreductase [Alphaproteobacteria bacterium]|nr:SDR family NAD(P)-dependent oxidoreductase [Alphaproteobacteria bacterium]
MKYLITGGAGFIGSNLADRLLAKGHNVVVVDNFNDYYDVNIKEKNVRPNLSNPNYVLYRADIENKDEIAKIFAEHKFDAVIHLAARAGVRPSLERSMDYVKTNIFGTVNILECMRQYGVKKMVFASSSSVYGNCSATEFSEDLKVTEPISPYAATKSACEQLLFTWHHLYGISVVALRFFTVYGPRQRPDLAIRKFAHKINAGEPIQMYGDGTTKRDYTYIDDIVDGICTAIDYNKTGYEIINLGGGEPITLSRMIETIEKTIGKKAIIHQQSMQPGDVDKTVCDWSKAHKLLGYTPKTTFTDGIKKFIDWSNKNADF